jgi:hypothetical protein
MKEITFALTYSHDISVTVVQALVTPMQVALGAEICRPITLMFWQSLGRGTWRAGEMATGGI